MIGPGVLAVERRDLARAERTAERAIAHRPPRIDQAAICLTEHGDTDHEPVRGVIRAWSGRSRARMVRRLAELDWTPVVADATRPPAMITLTYPGDWLTVAPNRAAVDRHLRAFYARWERAWDEPIVCAWKFEFQRRGAPHWAAFLVPPQGRAGEHRRASHEAALLAWEASGRAGRRPYHRPMDGDGLTFRQWLSFTWADIVAHPDPEQHRRHERAGTGVDYADGMRSADPRRLAVYFTKHGQFRAKEYQNEPPAEWLATGESVGRFWGYRGLARATATVDLADPDADRIVRTLRRYARAQRVTRQIRVRRHRGGRADPALEVVGLAGAQLLAAHRARHRTVRRPARRMTHGAGFLCVNDGPAMAAILARLLADGAGFSYGGRRPRL